MKALRTGLDTGCQGVVLTVGTVRVPVIDNPRQWCAVLSGGGDGPAGGLGA